MFKMKYVVGKLYVKLTEGGDNFLLEPFLKYCSAHAFHNDACGEGVLETIYCFNSKYSMIAGDLSILIAIHKGSNFDIESSNELCHETNSYVLDIIWKRKNDAVRHLKINKRVIQHFFKVNDDTTIVQDAICPTEEINCAQSCDQLYEALKISKDSNELLNVDTNISMQHSSLKPQLRPYQEQATRWMIHRERAPADTVPNHLYQSIALPDGSVLYYSLMTGHLSVDKPATCTFPSGGILADEMGLGKTVEILALILMNRRVLSNDIQSEDASDASEINNIQSSIQACPRPTKEASDIPLVDTKMSKSQNSQNNKLKNKSQSTNVMDKMEVNKNSQLSNTRNIKKTPKTNALPASNKVRMSEDNEREDISENDIETKSPKPKSVNRALLEELYQRELATMSAVKYLKKGSMVAEKTNKFQCICGEQDEREHIVCSICGKKQHDACMNKYNLDVEKSGRHLCPACWKSQPLVVSGATFIVTPPAICDQWENEIQKHIQENKLKVLKYNGVSKGWIAPDVLAQHDIVLTTYTVLRSEIHFAEPKAKRLRSAPKYDALVSPLLCVEWWRVCLDEVQMVESGIGQTSEMVRELPTIHRWGVTGTPIQRGIQDLYGLFIFLKVAPYDDIYSYDRLVDISENYQEPSNPLVQVLGKIFWRTCKKDVIDQINIPPQTEEVHWLNFSSIETFFYKTQHKRCLRTFALGLRKFDSVDKLGDFNAHTLNSILAPLLSLRQECTQPTIRNNNGFISGNKPLTMQELVDHLIKKTKLDAEENLRLCVSELNGLAGLYILKEDYKYAIQTYKHVLEVSVKYTDSLHIDSLQRLHAYSNLGEVYTMLGIDDIDDTQKKADELEVKYCMKYANQLISVQNDVVTATQSVNDCQNKFTGRMDEWWRNLILWAGTTDKDHELYQKVYSDVSDVYSNQGKYINSIKNTSDLDRKVCNWFVNVYKSRTKIQSIVNKLKIAETDTVLVFNCPFVKKLSSAAAGCHLRSERKPSSRKKKSSDCMLCQMKNMMHAMEGAVYCVREVANHWQGEILTNQQVSWKPSPEEWIIKSFVSFGKSKGAPEIIVKDGEAHLAWIEAVRKEFKDWGKLWKEYNSLIMAMDELTMCKSRMQKRDCSTYFEEEPTTKKSRCEKLLDKVDDNYNRNVVGELEIDKMMRQFQCDRQMHQQLAEKHHQTLLYLINLKKDYVNMEFNNEPCPICRDNLGKEWIVFACGHCHCIECYTSMGSHANLGVLICSVCRNKQRIADVSFAHLNQQDPKSDINVDGCYSTKIEAIVKFVHSLKIKEPDVKVIVFSKWESVLKYIAMAFSRNGISHQLQNLSSPTKINQFKDLTKHITCLLLPLRFGSKGLNLIEATHLILTEPLLNPGEEKQAISRIHRIGQKKPTFIHRFIVHGTVEENIYNVLNGGLEQNRNKSDKDLTLSQLLNLFGEEPAGSEEYYIHQP